MLSPIDDGVHRRKTDVRLLARKVTVGWIALVLVVVFVSVGLIAYSVKANFDADRARDERNRVTECEAANRRRADAKTVALSDVSSDRQIWNAIDEIIADGIPEPARSTIFAGLDMREALIFTTYVQVECQPVDETSP